MLEIGAHRSVLELNIRSSTIVAHLGCSLTHRQNVNRQHEVLVGIMKVMVVYFQFLITNMLLLLHYL